jgi:hypothetical protein
MKILLRLIFILFVVLSVTANARMDSTSDEVFEQEYSDSVVYDFDYRKEYEADTLKLQPRDFDEAKVQELKEDEDFNYAEAPTVGESLWDRFWRWVGNLIGKMLGKMATTNWGNVLLYLLALGVLIVIVMAVLKVDAFRVLSGSNSGVTKGVFHENIHEMNFDELLQQAIAKGDFRNAVRLVFLQSLKILSDKQHINWQPGKTNHDYLDEVQATDVKQGLGQLSYYFDYAWYGGFSISENQYQRVKTIFESWRGTVK